MLRPEVGAQVHDLPAPEGDEQQGGGDAEPLDAVVGALVGVAEALLAGPEVVHLADHLADHLLNPPHLHLHRLQLLRRLDRRPVLRVRPDVHVQLDVSVRVSAACRVGGFHTHVSLVSPLKCDGFFLILHAIDMCFMLGLLRA